MFIFKITSFLLFVHVATSFEQDKCIDNYRLKDNTNISDIHQFCVNKTCFFKCCGAGEMFSSKQKCINIDKMFAKLKRCKYLKKDVNFTRILLFDGLSRSNKLFSEDFVYNDIDLQQCTYEHDKKVKFLIQEDGSAKIEVRNGLRPWNDVPKLEYCIDFRLILRKEIQEVRLVMREMFQKPKDPIRSIFTGTAMVISCFFLLLVIIVYCLLPKLLNIGGLIMLAYTGSLFVTFLLKSFTNLGSQYTSADTVCKAITPVIYFGALSIFFWLNVMSFDIWWTLRGHRKCRDVHHRGELAKFRWYCVYAWGSPLLITIVATVVDNVDLTQWPSIVKPPFESCFIDRDGVIVYYHIVIGIICLVNFSLFIATIYNIYKVNRAVQSNQYYRKSKNETNRFVTYLKLSVVMGIGWITEIIDNKYISTEVYIMLHSVNLLVGVIIFFLFVFQKEKLVMLCKKFKYDNRYIRSLESSQCHKSGTTKSTRTSTVRSHKPEDKTKEMESVF